MFEISLRTADVNLSRKKLTTSIAPGLENVSTNVLRLRPFTAESVVALSSSDFTVAVASGASRARITGAPNDACDKRI